jgi:hypothetical protein
MPESMHRIFSFFLKLVLSLFAAVFAFSLLAVTLTVLVFSVLASLVAGRKPVPAMMFGRFKQFSQAGMWPGGSQRATPFKADTRQVVDVDVREIREDKRSS